MNKESRKSTILGALLATLLVGCSNSPPTRLYMIEPIVSANHAAQGDGITLAVGPISMPGRLNRKEILTHDQRYRVDTAEFDRWAEPLEDNIGAVLAENLSVLIPTDRVAVYPWNDAVAIDYTVRVRIHQFASQPGGEVLLLASWSVYNGGTTLITHKKGRYIESRGDTELVSVVAAMSRAMEQMSRDIADSLKSAASASRRSHQVDKS
jgi:uncharacterized lipoprotein YmbA